MEPRPPDIASVAPLSLSPPPPPVLRLNSQPMRITFVDEAPGQQPAMTRNRPLSPLMAETFDIHDDERMGIQHVLEQIHWAGSPAGPGRQAQDRSRRRQPSAEDVKADKIIDEFLAEMGIVVPSDALQERHDNSYNDYSAVGGSSRSSDPEAVRNVAYFDPELGDYIHRVNDDTVPEEKPYVVEVLVDDEDEAVAQEPAAAGDCLPPTEQFLATDFAEEAAAEAGPSSSFTETPPSSAMQMLLAQAPAQSVPAGLARKNRVYKGKHPKSSTGSSQHQHRGEGFRE